MVPGGPRPHRRRWIAGIVQAVAEDGVADLGPGYLDPDLLPTGLIASAYEEALAEYGAAALSYGENQGVLPLRRALAARAATGGPSCGPEHVLVTAGTSQALHLLTTTLAEPGDVVLCEPLSYDLGLRILADRGLLLRPIASDVEGPDPQAMAEAARAHRRAGRRIAFAYLMPTFHNPTGLLVGERRRRELVAVARENDIPIVEDDAYTELRLDPVAMPPSLAELAEYDGVIRLCTFSKTLGPGLRLGWMLADPALTGRLAAGGLLTSGGGLNHLASLAVTALVTSGRYDHRLVRLRRELRVRRDALVSGLGGGVDVPSGGFFLWVPGLCPEAAERTGVRVADGSRFGRTPGPAVRLSYSFNPPGELAAAGRRLSPMIPHRTTV
ncbi:aminotransferase class I/II-fold pyridoxal phosphate-dependent enzyme [Microbispora hainanensis]|uniref:Aminotransferase class I/II-fold pyridoxal phosphate-dependent enzyme n=1 Tax=Microbispora hainanensis TaxID=568844 RepID=A0A544Z2M7_9ACTN|nr:aminotransferase class I/II-fold pyridoxal phosphate-dependent enzyme [Microbispora hainanensis]